MGGDLWPVRASDVGEDIVRFIEKTLPIEYLNPVAMAEGNAKNLSIECTNGGLVNWAAYSV